MLKFGFRKLHFYPLMFLLFTLLRKINEIILKTFPFQNNINFLIPLIIFFTQALFGFILYLCYSHKNKLKDLRTGSNENLLSPFKYQTVIFSSNKFSFIKDRKVKILFLIIFTSLLNCIETLIRNEEVLKFVSRNEIDGQLEIRVRGIQIIISSLLCHYTIRTKIYKHQKLTLIIVSIFFSILIGMELCLSKSILMKLLVLSICLLSYIFRALQDVTEKYLFEFDYINVFLMLVYEGLFGLIFDIIFLLQGNSFKNEGKYLFNYLLDFKSELLIFIILIFFYIIIVGFANGYRVTTNKYYSPISRALIQSTLDPFQFLYNNLSFNKKDDYEFFWIHFAIVLFCLTVISFFSLVYNDFIILYCCGLEYNTYCEITNRLYKKKVSKDSVFSDYSMHSFSSSINSENRDSVDIELEGNYIIHIK